MAPASALEIEGIKTPNRTVSKEAAKSAAEKVTGEVKKKPLPEIRRERLEPEGLAEIVTREAERINLVDLKAVIEKRSVKVFDREEVREVINIGDNVMIYGLYHRVTDNDGTFRDVFYSVVPLNNLALAYCKDMHSKGIVIATPRRAARLAILIETYCRLFVDFTVSPDIALSVSSGLDGPDNKKPVFVSAASSFVRKIGFVQ
jgi:hypothetical protein